MTHDIKVHLKDGTTREFRHARKGNQTFSPSVACSGSFAIFRDSSNVEIIIPAHEIKQIVTSVVTDK